MTETTETKRPVQPDDLFKLKFIQGAALSPDGKKAVYLVERVDEKELKAFTSLWMLDIVSGESRPFTSEKTGGSAPAWSPDGKKIAFISASDEIPQVFIIPTDGGEAYPLTKMKQGVGGGPVWSPDGKLIAFTAGPKTEEKPDPKKPYRLTRNVYRFDGVGYLHDKLQDLYIIPAEGGEAKQLTSDDLNYSSPVWSPDGKEILYLAALAPDSFSSAQTMKIVDLEGKARGLIKDWGEIGQAVWMPDGKNILFTGAPAGTPIGTKSDLWLVSKDGGAPECRTATLTVGVGGGLQPDMPVSLVSPLTVDKAGKKAWMNVQEGGKVEIYEIALSGTESCTPVVGGEQTNTLLGKTGDIFLYAVSTFQDPINLYCADAAGKNSRQLTHINDEIIQYWKQPEVEHLLYPSVDGKQVEGWLMKPATGEAPYPTVLYIHGGPHSAFGYTFSFDFRMLSGAGFAVLFVNHRASMGYGDEFSTAIKGDWGNLDYNDLMYGVDYAIAKGLSDADRLGVCGISGGGNLSCWIVGNTNRFKAAVPENPVANWLSFYGVSDIGVWFAVEELGGHPHEIPEIYRKCSPVTYAHNCTTPTLLVQGEMDFRCPAEQSEQFYTILKANGCIAEMVRLPNSSHTGSITGAPVVRKYQNEVLLGWMNRYVLGKSA
ncbi:MAG: S9 family peptidase [Chloroflexi bacterium]|nr:S9 family peptidase [Chloroflexota bacterium]